MKKAPVAIIAAAAALVTGAALTMLPSRQPAPQSAAQPASAEDAATATQSDIQTLEVTAKGGYSPATSTLKAGVPAILRVITQSTFDCSSSLVIPALGYEGRLPMTGTTEINIPPQPAGTTLTGLCSMGMYSFTVTFI